MEFVHQILVKILNVRFNHCIVSIVKLLHGTASSVFTHVKMWATYCLLTSTFAGNGATQQFQI
jgi:hypothetical protein